jgi:hypothetical protein
MLSRYVKLIPITVSLVLTFGAGPILARGDWTGNLSINPYPSPCLSDWESNPTAGQAEITNNTSDTAREKIFLTIERNGSGIVASGNSVVFDFPPGSAQNIPFSDLVDCGSLQYNRDLENTALRTGRLPEGDYRACILCEDAARNRLLDNVCTSFTVIYPDPPFLTFPFDGDTISTGYPVFQWTPVQVPPRYPFHYSLLIVEVLSGQLPSQALAANIPQYENDDITTTSLQYPIDALPLDDSATYAWQVQALEITVIRYHPMTARARSGLSFTRPG